MKYADPSERIVSLEFQLEQHREALKHYRETGDRMRVVTARLNILQIEMTLAQLRREAGL